MIGKNELAATLNAISDGVLIAVGELDEGMKIIFANKAFESLYGYQAKEITERNIDFLGKLTNDSDAIEGISNSFRAHQSHHIKELRTFTKSGSELWIELRVEPIFSDEGNLTHFILVEHDISKHRVVVAANNRNNMKLHSTITHLTDLASHDHLTNLYNRRFFDSELVRQCSFHQRHNMPLALAFIDIDYFKKYNDYYGHLAGDQTLKEVAAEIKRRFSRIEDVAVRYGGEEFVVLSACEPDYQTAYNHFEDLISAIESLKIEHNDSPVSNYITVSMGVYIGIPSDTRDGEFFKKMADAAMYQAKQLGRNQLFIQSDELIGLSAAPALN